MRASLLACVNGNMVRRVRWVRIVSQCGSQKGSSVAACEEHSLCCFPAHHPSWGAAPLEVPGAEKTARNVAVFHHDLCENQP